MIAATFGRNSAGADSSWELREMIIFVDAVCPIPYNADLDRQRATGLGGTEGSLVRLATKLAETRRVIVAQHNRDRAEISGGVEFVPLRHLSRDLRPDAVVVLRRPDRLWDMRTLFPHARLFLWLHDWHEPPPHWYMHRRNQARHLRMVLALLTTDSTLVCVSAAHLANIEKFARRGLIRSEFPLNRVRRTYVYNVVSVPEHLRNPATRRPANPNKLLFGSVWKGLDLVLTAFEHVRRTLPDAELHVSFYAPPNMNRLPPNVVNLGQLSHDEFCEHLADSFCYFYPAYRVPETFGLVFGESHAVGTPVLAHHFGAAPELLSPAEVMDARNLDAVANRLSDWYSNGRPAVTPRPEYLIADVARRWGELFDGA
jgi:glycosyltransferase involved in cell wall biosynthesis